MHVNVIFKKFFVLVLAVALIAGLFFPVSLIRSSAATTAADLSGDIKRGSVSVDYGCSVGFRFNAANSFTSVSLEINIGTNGGKKVVFLLRKWDTNMNVTVSKDPVARKSIDSWNKNDYVKLSASDAGLSEFPAGEYYASLYLEEGSSYKFNWYTPANKNVDGFSLFPAIRPSRTHPGGCHFRACGAIRPRAARPARELRDRAARRAV